MRKKVIFVYKEMPLEVIGDYSRQQSPTRDNPGESANFEIDEVWMDGLDYKSQLTDDTLLNIKLEVLELIH